MLKKLKLMKKPIVAVIMGGFSSEREISLRSGENVFKSIDLELFEPYKVLINKDEWLVNYNDTFIKISKDDFSFLHPVNNRQVKFELVWNIIHGDPGENGKIQGYFDMLQIPYTGGGVEAMSVSMNKKTTNDVLVNYGIPVLPSMILNIKKINTKDIENIDEEIGYPCIMKPVSSGSSFGLSILESEKDLKNTLRELCSKNEEIMIEQYQKGIEVTCGVIEYNSSTIALPLTEIMHSGKYFFNHDSKYKSDTGTQEITPAVNVKGDTAKVIQDFTIKAFDKLGLKTCSRADYIINDEGIHFLEINAIPGFSLASILPQQLEAAGISHNEFITYTLRQLL